MATLSWSLTVQISGSAAVTLSRPSMETEAIDRIEVEIQPGGTGDSGKIVDLQPGESSAVQLLVIKSSSYGPHLRFSVSNGVATDPPSSAVILDSPQIFSGGGIALFGVAPRQLRFTNSSSDRPARVEILVARDATSPPRPSS